MANVNLQRTSWGYGELDQRMLGRTDLPTYKQGLVKMENWLPAKSGAAVMRGGMEQVKSIPTHFEADCIIPLRGGESPMLGLYNSTDQTFRVMKADGTWVGVTEANPAEVTLFDSVTYQHLHAADGGDDVEPYRYDPVLPGDAGSVTAAVNAFYDLIAAYATAPNASCFKIRLAITGAGAFSQDFSFAGGSIVVDRGTASDTQVLTLNMPHGAADDPRPDSAIVNRALSGPNTCYIEKLILRRIPHTATDKVDFHLETSATGFEATDGSLSTWELGSSGPGTVTVLFNDDPGVTPMWSVEPNVEYDEVVVRLFRPNSDVKVYKITDTTITEDVHNETSADLVGAVVGGKQASHGAYFEQRIVYGGGRDHRQEIVGSRSPNPLTGDRRYGGWSLSDTTTTSVDLTHVQLFTCSEVDVDRDYQGGHIQTSATQSEANQLLIDGFGATKRYHHSLELSYNESHSAPYGHFKLRHGTVQAAAADGSDLESSPVNTEGGLRVSLIHGAETEVTIPLGRADGSIGRDTSDPYILYHITGAQESDAADLLTTGEFNSIRSFIDDMNALKDAGTVPEASAFTIKYELGDTKSTSVTTVNADNAFKWVIDTGTTFAEVRWLQSFSGVLTVGTSAGIAICKFLNPDDPPEIRWHSSQCVSRKPPLSTPLGVLAVSADKTAVYEVIRKRDLTAYSEDRFRQDKIQTIAWQQQPIQRLWVVTEAGVIHTLTIQEENGVNGWAQITHQHSGTCTGVVVTPGDDEDDTVWFLMKYGAQSYVEKYHEANNNLHSNRLFMDSAVKRKVGRQTLVTGNYIETGRKFGDTNNALGGGALSNRGFVAINLVITDGGNPPAGSDVVDQKVSSIFTGDPALNIYLATIIMFDTETVTASRGSGGGNEHAGVVTQGYGGSYEEEFMAAIDFDGAVSAEFITDGSITVTHTAPISGTVDTVTFKMAGAVQEGGGGNPYLLTDADLTTNGDKTNFVAFCNKIRSATGYYPDAVSVGGSNNFSIELSLDTPKVAIPLNMVGATGKKLYITSASAGGTASETAKYEIIDSPATETFLTTDFREGDDVWVGFQVIGDMELPAIEQSISSRAAGSWLGQPARVPWVVSGVEKAHSVKIGPTYDKLVEYFADTTTLSFTVSMTETTDTSEPYVWATSGFDESAVVAWSTAVRLLHAAGNDLEGASLFTMTLTAGGVSQTITANAMDIDVSEITFAYAYRTANQINSTIAGGATRFPAGVNITSAGEVTLLFDVAGGAGATAGHDLSADFESAGTLTITRTANAPLVTGHERRAMPGHVTTTEPVVIRKDTPSPCTMTYLVTETTVG